MNKYLIYSIDQDLVNNILSTIETEYSEIPNIEPINSINLNGHSDISNQATYISMNSALDIKKYSKNFKVFFRQIFNDNYITVQSVDSNVRLLELKTELKQQLTSIADNIHISPIGYDSKTLDADEVAQQNISGKITQLQNEIALAITSANLFWKDHDNIIHTWADVSTYLAWLQGLQVAIATRRTNLYQTLWQAKTQIDSLTTVDALKAININTIF